MKLIAVKQIYIKDAGILSAPGETFEIDDERGQQLLVSGSVRKEEPPCIRYETKVILPAATEVSARRPFRDVSVLDEEPADVALEGDRVLPESDVSAYGALDPGGRSGRARSAPKR